MNRSIGQRLRQAREKQNRTLEEATYTTKIRARYLKAMEEDNFEVLPSPTHQRGFLRSYAGFLGMDSEALVSELQTGAPRSYGKAESTAEKSTPDELSEINELESMGRSLKSQREILGFSYADVERQIHVKPRYLNALEEGRFDDLPSPVQGRGMLNNYIDFLGLDPDPLLLTFAEEIQARLEKTKTQRIPQTEPATVELKEPTWTQRVFSQQVIVSLLFGLILVSVIFWGAFQVFGQRADRAQASPTIPGVADVLLPSDTPSPSPTASLTPQAEIQVDVANPTLPSEETTEVENTPAPIDEEEGTVQVQLVIKQRTWVQVIVDGEEEFNGRMLPGSAYIFSGSERVEILTGNAAGVTVFYNQQEIGVLGIFGGLANLIFTEEGIYTPTPTITPTPAATATPTPTMTPTTTPTSTAPVDEGN